jgi:hypothetical protein
MIADLSELNRLIAQHWLGHLSQEEEAYVHYASVCIGQLEHSAHELTQLLSRLNEERWAALSTGELNQRYLRFVRLAATDASLDSIDSLVRLGITMRQAAFFRALSDADLERLAFGCAGPMMRFAVHTFKRGVRLHSAAGRHHATALVAARESPTRMSHR